MKYALIAILSIVVLSNAQATLISPNGEVLREWSSYDKAKLSKEVEVLKAKYTNTFFGKWLSDSLEKKVTEKTAVAKFFSFFKSKKMIDVKGDELLGDADRTKDQVRCYRFNGACNLFKEVGYERGTIMIYIYDQFGVNTTHHVTETYESVKKYNGFQKYFTKDELLAIVIGLELFGDNIKYHENDKLTMTYADIDNGDTIANALIYFFKDWRREDFVDKVATVLHEMYHKLAGSYSINSGTGLKIDFRMDWAILHDESRKIRNKDGYDCFVSNYATTNLFEDSAETLVAYFHNRKVLEKLCPQKIAIIEDAIKIENLARSKRTSKFIKSFGENVEYLFESLDKLIASNK